MSTYFVCIHEYVLHVYSTQVVEILYILYHEYFPDSSIRENIVLNGCIIPFRCTTNSLPIPLKTHVDFQMVVLLYCSSHTCIKTISLIMTLESEIWNCRA